MTIQKLLHRQGEENAEASQREDERERESSPSLLLHSYHLCETPAFCVAPAARGDC
jgi:hypothetical protein